MSKKRRNKRIRIRQRKSGKVIQVGGHVHEVTTKSGFLSSLENYLTERRRQAGIGWEWLGVGLAAIVLGASMAAGYMKSTPLFADTGSVILSAATLGDYQTAQHLYNTYTQASSAKEILGVDTELEELVYPEIRIGREIEAKERLLEKYPGSRDILLILAKLYRETGNVRSAQSYWEQAQKLDPNNEVFK